MPDALVEHHHVTSGFGLSCRRRY
jgi:hypothetical protein